MDGDSAVFAWNHLTMTSQFQKWLREPIMGPVIFALWIALPVGITYHFLVKAKS